MECVMPYLRVPPHFPNIHSPPGLTSLDGKTLDSRVGDQVRLS